MLTQAPDSTLLRAEAGTAPDRLAHRRNLMHLVELRWIAVAGQLLTILAVQYLLAVPLPLREMLTLLAVLALFNLASWLRTRLALPVVNAELLGGMLVDVAVLAGQLYYSGGVTNPFIFLFLLQVAVATILLRRPYVWAMVAASVFAFGTLTMWHWPLALSGLPTSDLPVHYVGGLLLCFVLNAALLVIYVGRISRNLRQRDEALAKLRQRAVEEEHIVRMGLLASGAAHELGTPLATLAVILGDWSRMAPFAGEPELREEIEEMQRQIARCKAIVSGILSSAGETRGDHPEKTTLHGFLDGTLAEWQSTRAATLDYRREGPDLPIISDTALRQMIGNILDNALEAAPGAPLRVRAEWDEDTLTLRVRDRGPGFPDAMLERLGTPYQSSKGAPGRGLGLFLSVNVARALGGQVAAHNVNGGAEVTITLPLAALTPEEEDRDDGR